MRILLVFLSVFILQGCKISGLTDDYGKLNNDEKTTIKSLVSFEELIIGNVYLINSIQLKNEIAKYPKSLVYVFKNGCTSKMCKPMLVYENFASKNGYKLFLVMNGFSDLKETTNQPLKSQLFAIDSKFYNTNYRSRYTKYFENEIMGNSKEFKGQYLGNLFFFENGNFIEVKKDLP